MTEQVQEQEQEVQEQEAKEKAPRTAIKVIGVTKEAALTVLIESNPKRPGSDSRERFEGYYRDGIETVQDALDAGLTMGDIKYDIAHQFIEVEGAEAVEYEVQSRSARAKKEKDPDLEETASEENLLESDSGDIFGENAAATDTEAAAA